MLYSASRPLSHLDLKVLDLGINPYTVTDRPTALKNSTRDGVFVQPIVFIFFHGRASPRTSYEAQFLNMEPLIRLQSKILFAILDNDSLFMFHETESRSPSFVLFEIPID